MDSNNATLPGSSVTNTNKASVEAAIEEYGESIGYFDQEMDITETEYSLPRNKQENDFEREHPLQELSQEKNIIFEPENKKPEFSHETENIHSSDVVSNINERQKRAKRNMWATHGKNLQENVSVLKEDYKIPESSPLQIEKNTEPKDLIQFIEDKMMHNNLNIKFEDIISNDKAKRALQESIVLPILVPQFFTGIRTVKSTLLCGPVKSDLNMLVKAAASQAKATLFIVSIPQLLSQKHFSLEDTLKQIFELAKLHAPSIIEYDQIELLGRTTGTPEELQANRRVLIAFLMLKDSLEQFHQTSDKLVMIIGTTERPWELLGSIRRRLETRIYIELPNDEERKQIFEENLKKIKVSKNINLEYLAKQTKNFNSLDIEIVCKEALMFSQRRQLQNITKVNEDKDYDAHALDQSDAFVSEADFAKAIRTIGRSVSDMDIRNFNNWINDYGRL